MALTEEMSANEMLEAIRATLRARAEGRKEGGDKVIMELVDQIVERECDWILP